MEHARLEVVYLKPRKVLLQYDAQAHEAKVKHQPRLYASNSTDDHETVSDDARVAAYTALLDFIVGAQQECYALFGDDEGRWPVDDGAAEEPTNKSRGSSSSLRVNSNEWSEDDNLVEAVAGRKRKRQKT
jgi:hypothetical protein